MKTLIAFSFLFVPSLFIATQAQAQTQTELTYVCEVIIAGTSLKIDEGVWKFMAPASSGSHGGEARSFKAGEHEVMVIADAQWLGISWFRNDKKIAEGVFVLGGGDRTMSRVAILYDPTDSGEQVSIGCTEGVL